MQDKLASLERLSDCVASFVKKFNVIMRSVLMKEEGSLSMNVRDVRYRRDVVFAQAVSHSNIFISMQYCSSIYIIFARDVGACYI